MFVIKTHKVKHKVPVSLSMEYRRMRSEMLIAMKSIEPNQYFMVYTKQQSQLARNISKKLGMQVTIKHNVTSYDYTVTCLDRLPLTETF